MSVNQATGSLFKSLKRLPRKLFGSRNERMLKRYARTAQAAITFEPELRRLCTEGDDYDAAFAARVAQLEQPESSDHEAVAAYQRQLQDIRVELSQPLRERSEDLARRIAEGTPVEGLLPEGFAIIREASRRVQRHRHFDCQLIGGHVLYDGCVAEMRTGEGKTIVCHLACYMQMVQGLKAHVVTVNDYLVKRDAEFATPIFELLGFSVGYIQAQVDPGGREGIRQQAYGCDLTYGTASEFGFDYLRDNMKTRLAEQVQGRLDYVIIDEVDSILIDEARTPLIISGPARDDVTRYSRANKVADELVRRQAQWDRKLMRTVARYDGDSKNIPKLDDAMRILGYKESPGGKRRVEAAETTDDESTETEGPRPTLGPDFLTDDQVEAIQIYEHNLLQLPQAEQYHRFFIVQEERKQAGITHDGVTIAQDLLEMGSLYAGANMEWPHLIENSLRAHKVYQRDRDYVVQDREIIIVDPFTGRLMHGRQWSDGLHQAIEAKEGVPVKEETQTLATITIQNFFKLYKERAGMTGTALTEATEFMKIYNLEVVEIPTNRPINRLDHNDKMYRDTEEKYHAIVDEIHEIRRRGRPADPFLIADALTALKPILAQQGADVARINEALQQFARASTDDRQVVRFMLEVYDEAMGDLVHGRPILVGTTSVENSEKLSRLLDRRYGIEHEVLNAKNHAREADIVMKAGQQTLPTQGADKTPLGNVTIATNMAGRGTDIKLGEGVVYRTCRVPEQLPTGCAETGLYPPGLTKCCITCAEYDPATNCAHCFKPKLDPRFPALGRKVCTISTPCGLHIIGTERHEARRIDNQLRGRAGRQGDPGSSRFSLSLADDLLKLFMSEWMLKMMERLGFSAGSSLEDKRLTKGIERAQRKVEERNFSSRKNLLEWDEPMDFQRKEFYSERQRILEERDLPELIFDTIERSIDSQLEQFLSGSYHRTCVAEWCRANLELNLKEEDLQLDDLESAEKSIRRLALDEAADQIRTSLGEYIDPEEPPDNWDVGGLVQWAARSFQFSVSQNRVRKMDPEEIHDALYEAAQEHYAKVSLDGIALYLDQRFPQRALAEWARSKFNIALDEEELTERGLAEASTLIKGRVREAYRRREIAYPVEYALERAFGAVGTDNATGAEALVRWVNNKYRQNWALSDVQGKLIEELHATLVSLNESFLSNGKFDQEIAEHVTGKSDQELHAWAQQRFGPYWNQRRFESFEGEREDAVRDQGREMCRRELTMLEQYVLLHIYDQAWKDHLLEMDHLRHGIMHRPMGGDQTHPQSQYAIEGRDLFNQMWARVAGRVTDMVFKVSSVGTPVPAAGAAAARMSTQHADATGGGFTLVSRDRAAAMRAQNVEQAVETIRREQPKVGRNSPCPCGSGKKYKQCCGKQ